MANITDDRINTTAEMITPGITARRARIIATPAASWPDVEADWRRLTAQTPYQSIFLGSDWIGTWIKHYQQKLNIEIVRIYDGAHLIAVCLLNRRTEWKGPIPVRKVYLNAAGEDQWEEVGTEFNHFMCLPGWEEMAAAALVRYLDRTGWDEFVLAGCVRSDALTALQSAFGLHSVNREAVRSYYIDLTAVRATGKPFEMTLSYKSRYNIRQSIKLYRECGPLKLERAQDVDQAHEMLAELAELHEERWAAKGKLGAFASPRFRSFHYDLLIRLFGLGRIDLIRVSAGSETIGVIYNLIGPDQVFFYQCGFRITSNKRLRPGLVSLQTALEWYRESGVAEFDLMAGDLEYKRSFSDQFRDLEWCTIRRRGWRTALLDSMRYCRHRYQKARQKRNFTSQVVSTDA
jgi:CelD/BcsL family acetyltransferase involved in cellulose biosynthesis